jgi:hypothetical protein
MGRFYDITHLVVSLTLWGWFRETRVIGKENIPYRKPMIL